MHIRTFLLSALFAAMSAFVLSQTSAFAGCCKVTHWGNGTCKWNGLTNTFVCIPPDGHYPSTCSMTPPEQCTPGSYGGNTCTQLGQACNGWRKEYFANGQCPPNCPIVGGGGTTSSEDLYSEDI